MLDTQYYYDVFLKDIYYHCTCTCATSAFPCTARVNQLCFSTGIQKQNTLRDHLKFISWCNSFPEDNFSSLASHVLGIKHTSNLPVAQEWYTGCTFCVLWCGSEHLLPIFIHTVSTLIIITFMAAPSISCPRKDNSNWKYLFQNHLN